MKIKIFKRPVSELANLETEVNNFVSGKTVAQIEQSVLEGGASEVVMITVLYNS